MPTLLDVGDKVGIKKGSEEGGNWGILRKVGGEFPNYEYHVAIRGEDSNTLKYRRAELRKWRTPKAQSSESVSNKIDTSTVGKLSEGQLEAFRVDLRGIRALNEYRLFLEVSVQGKPYLLSIEGLTYGTLADYLKKNKIEE